MPECKEGQEINPITNRCRKIVCDGTKVYNVKKKNAHKKSVVKVKLLTNEPIGASKRQLNVNQVKY